MRCDIVCYMGIVKCCAVTVVVVIIGAVNTIVVVGGGGGGGCVGVGVGVGVGIDAVVVVVVVVIVCFIVVEVSRCRVRALLRFINKTETAIYIHTSMHCIALRCTASHYTALRKNEHCMTQRYSTILVQQSNIQCNTVNHHVVDCIPLNV